MQRRAERTRGRTVAAVAAGVALAACAREPAPAPLVVLVVVDTLRADAVLDPAGRPATPAVARLAADGVVFPLAFTHAPSTVPSHASLFSGRLPTTTGVHHNGDGVPDDLPLLAEHLAAEGFATRAVGALAILGRRGDRGGFARGFESFELGDAAWRRAPEAWPDLAAALDGLAAPAFLFAHLSDPHEPYHAADGERAPVEARLRGAPVGSFDAAGVGGWRGEVLLEPGANALALEADTPLQPRVVSFEDAGGSREASLSREAYRTPVPTVEAVLENPLDRPVRGVLTLIASDAPDLAVQRARYAEEVALADRYVGRLLDALDRAGLYDDALIVFASDHGEAFGEHGHVDHGQTLFDEELRVPLVVKLPAGHAGRGALRAAAEGVVGLADVAPTVLDALGLPPLPGQEGRSLLAPRAGEPVVAQTHVGGSRWCLRDARFKLVLDVDAGRFELYDLAADPEERTDRFADLAAERPDWPARLAALAASVNARFDVDAAPEGVRETLRALGYH